MGDGIDHVRLGTLAGGSAGVNFNAGAETADPDGDDLRLVGVDDVVISAGLGRDSNVIDGRGGPEFAAAVPVEMEVSGLGGDDVISVGSGIGRVDGNAGNDTVRGGPGLFDVLRGGSGRDTLAYDDAPGAITMDLGLSALQDTGGAGVDVLDPAGVGTDFEDLIGSAFDDNLTETNAANEIVGGPGVDTIAALDGNDNVRVDDGVSGDRADCGGGIDTATADALGPTPLDTLIACETPAFVDRTPATATCRFGRPRRDGHNDHAHERHHPSDLPVAAALADEVPRREERPRATGGPRHSVLHSLPLLSPERSRVGAAAHHAVGYAH